MTVTTLNANHYLAERRLLIDQQLMQHLPPINSSPQRLHTAMRYAVLNGGKRLRPLLVYATGETFGATLTQLDNAACAVEFIHAYSLIHDDLPAMDNDDMRRGQPTCHIAFDEATAILAGDALQAFAFEILVTNKTLTDQQLLKMLTVLAQACSSSGMVGGQALEFETAAEKITPTFLDQLHAYKTGALIRASVQLGAIAADVNDIELVALEQYANNLGLAFQIQDDVLDHETSDTPFSYTRYFSLVEINKKIHTLYQQALENINFLGEKKKYLQWMAEYIIQEEFR